MWGFFYKTYKKHAEKSLDTFIRVIKWFMWNNEAWELAAFEGNETWQYKKNKKIKPLKGLLKDFLQLVSYFRPLFTLAYINL